MTQNARIRIDTHPLLQRESDVRADVSTVPESDGTAPRAGSAVRHIVVHVAIFVSAFIFTAGVALLGVLLWVRPDGLFALVLVGIGSSAVFVGAFVGLRILAIRLLHDVAADDTEAFTLAHHVTRSVVYALLALVAALLLAGVLINGASAGAESVHIIEQTASL